MTNPKQRVLVLAGPGESGRMLYGRLAVLPNVEISKIVLECREPRAKFLRRRAKRLGVVKVVGQMLFVTLVVPVLNRRSRDRIQQIKSQHDLATPEIPDCVRHNVTSIGDADTHSVLREVRGKIDVVVVMGTRIIPTSTLNLIDVPIVNIHAGITPRYRGTHGGYWALVEKNPLCCGVTLHHVDAGIDTGNIISQARIEPTKDDTFVTYPILQLAQGLELLERFLNGKPNTGQIAGAPSENTSKLWYHPTIWEYWMGGVR